jgi:transcriptional regulator with XRE-family HTH domain
MAQDWILDFERELNRARMLAALPPPATRRAIRERAGVSQQTLAGALGVTQAALSRWEAGLTSPRDELLLAYAQALRTLAREVVEQGAA